jgi:hypothetical protein
MNAKNQSVQTNDQKKNRKKGLVILLSLTTALVVVAGSLLAYFSDVYQGSTSMTAGTLYLEGSAKFYINDETMQDEATDDDLECINPGDTVIVVFTVTNQGSKSTWVKSFFTLSAPGLSGSQLSSAFTVYEGVGTSGSVLTADSESGSVSFSDANAAVLNGTIETESAAQGSNNGRTRTMTFTIVFDSSAGNSFQDAKIDVDYEVKALQYRNNPSPDWDLATPLVP